VTGTQTEELTGHLGAFLERQRWFARTEDGAGGEPVIVESEDLRSELPGLIALVVAAGGATYQVLVGLREEQEALGLLRGQ
jgi:Maltokinase N-terminal cap domain